MLTPYFFASPTSRCELSPPKMGSASLSNSFGVRLRMNQYPVIQHSGNTISLTACCAAASTNDSILAKLAGLSPALLSICTVATRSTRWRVLCPLPVSFAIFTFCTLLQKVSSIRDPAACGLHLAAHRPDNCTHPGRLAPMGSRPERGGVCPSGGTGENAANLTGHVQMVLGSL